MIYHRSLPSTDGSHSGLTPVQSNGEFGTIDASNPANMDHMLLRVGNGATVAEFMRKPVTLIS